MYKKYEVCVKSNEYKKFLPKYLKCKNTWDMFVQELSRQFLDGTVYLPLYQHIKNKEQSKEVKDRIFNSIVLGYDEELPMKTKILLGLEMCNNTFLGGSSHKEYLYKIRNWKKNPHIKSCVYYIEKEEQSPLELLYSFVGNCSLLVSNSISRIIVVTPQITIDKHNKITLTFQVPEDTGDEFIIKEPRIPEYFKEIEQETKQGDAMECNNMEQEEGLLKLGIDNVYTCPNCKFQFEKTDKDKHCPRCWARLSSAKQSLETTKKHVETV